MFNYKFQIIKYIILFIPIIWWGCTGEITIPEGPEFQFSSTYFSYDTSSNELYLYVEIENISLTNAIDYVRADLYNADGLEISSEELVPISNGIVSQNPYSKTYVINELKYDVYTVKFTMQDESGNLFSEDSDPKDLNPITPPLPSQIESYGIFDLVNGTYVEIVDTVTLDEHEWKELRFYLHVSDSNGVVDIAHIKYEIMGELLPCSEDTNGDGEILGGDEWPDYVDLSIPGHEWEFAFSNYYSVNGNYEASFIYHAVMRLRPRDGSALYVNGEPEPGYEARDCGKIGTVFIKFIVTDSSDGPTTIEDIPLDILAP